MTSEIISTDLSRLALAGGDESEDVEVQAEKRGFLVPATAHGQRIDKLLATVCPEFSRSYFQQLLADGVVVVNGQAAGKPATKVRAGDRVEVELRPTVQAQAFQPEDIPLQVVYEDEHLMVIDKPAGLVVHPAAGHWSGTLLNALLARHAGASALPRAGIVHRLDKDTSGLMLVGKTPKAVEALVRMIALREVHRIYVALAQGAWRGGQEVLVDQSIGRDPRNRLRMAVLAADAAGAKPAQTTLRVLDSGPAVTWVGCKLHTGRTHQIRVHLAWLGHPLVGDVLYGGRAALGLARQALHAHRLVLRHPITGDVLRLESALPPEMSQALREAGLHYNGSALWQVLD